MGLIARQSFKSATVTYLGVVLGVINTMFVYTKMLSVEQFGEITFLHTSAAIFASLLLFGLGGVLVRFYPKFRTSEEKSRSLLKLVFGVLFLNSLLFISAALLFKEELFGLLTAEEGVYLGTSYAIIAMAVAQGFIKLFTSLASIHGRIAIPSLLTQLIKVTQPLLVLLLFFKFIDFEEVILGIMFYYILLALVYFFYVNRLEKIPLTLKVNNYPFRTKPLFYFALFSIFTSLGSILMNQIDVVMITKILGKYSTGLYGWSLFIPNSIAIPYSLLGAISTPLIAKYWKNNDLNSLDKLYKQSSSTLLGISLGLFSCVIVGLDDLYMLMPKGEEYSLGKNLVIYLAIAKIVDMASGLNNAILSMSSSFKTLLIFLLIAVISNVGFNLLFIPRYGVEGSAFATLITILLYNLIKYSYIKIKYDLSPFTQKTIYIILLGLTVNAIGIAIPRTNQPFLNIIAFSGTIGLSYFLILYRFNLAPELNNFANKQLIRIGIKPFDRK